MTQIWATSGPQSHPDLGHGSARKCRAIHGPNLGHFWHTKPPRFGPWICPKVPWHPWPTSGPLLGHTSICKRKSYVSFTNQWESMKINEKHIHLNHMKSIKNNENQQQTHDIVKQHIHHYCLVFLHDNVFKTYKAWILSQHETHDMNIFVSSIGHT